VDIVDQERSAIAPTLLNIAVDEVAGQVELLGDIVISQHRLLPPY
jgi:hypothetical protein